MCAAPITTSRRLIGNTLWNMLSLGGNALVLFFLIPFFLGQLGQARYGVWVLIGSLFRYRGILCMGLNSAINQYVPMYMARDDQEGMQRTIGTALVFYLIMAFVCLAVTLLLYCYMDTWFGIAPELVPSARTLVLIVGIGFAVDLPLQLSTAVLSGLQRYDAVNATVLFMLLARTVLLVVLLVRGFGLITMGLVFGISEIMVRLVQWGFVRRLLTGISWTLKGFDLRLLREMLALGANTFLYTIGAVVLMKTTDLIIGALKMGMEAIARFSVATAAVLVLTQLLQAFTCAIMPAVSDLRARDYQARVWETAFLAQKYSLLLIIPSVCFFVVMGEAFLTVWVGHQMADPATIHTMATILALLAIGHGIRLTQHSNFLVLVGCGQHQIFGRLTAATALLVVLLSILAVTVFKIGLIGIAWAHLLPLAVVSGLVLPIYFSIKTGISIPQNVVRVWIPALWGSIPALIVILAWQYVSPPTNWRHLLAVILVAAIATLGGAWGLSLDTRERLRFRRLIMSWAGGRTP